MFLVCCKPEPNDQVISQTIQPQFLISSLCVDTPIIISNGSLEFSSPEHFISTYECLQKQLIEHNKQFVLSCNTSNDMVLDSLATINSYSLYEPLLDFEKQFPSFSSLRKVLWNDLMAWESSNDLKVEDDPSNPWFGDEVIWALLDQSGGVIIGGEQYNFSKDSLNKAFGDCLLARFPDREKITYSNGNKRVLITFSYACTIGTMLNPDVFHRKSYIKHQKKNSSGNWDLSFTNLYAAFECHPRNTSCVEFTNALGKIDANDHVQILSNNKLSLRFLTPWSGWEFPIHNRNCKIGDNGDTYAWGPLTTGCNDLLNPNCYQNTNVFTITW